MTDLHVLISLCPLSLSPSPSDASARVGDWLPPLATEARIVSEFSVKMTQSSPFTYRDIAKMIDHSLLSPTMTTADFEAGIRLALEYDVASVCLVPSYLQRCAELLAGSDVKPSTTIGFPHGGQATAAKVAESKLALEHGARELDMVINLHRTLSGDWAYARDAG